MIDLFDLYTTLCSVVNSQQGGLIRPNQAFSNWVRDIEMELYKEARLQFEESQIISDELGPFLRSVNVVVTPQRGANYDVIRFPKDYDYFCSARLNRSGALCAELETFTSEGNIYDLSEEDRLARIRLEDATISTIGIAKVTNNRWNSILSRETLRPDMDNPKCTQFDGGLKLAPKNAGIIQLDYLRTPVAGVLAYTIVNAGTEEEYYQYDASASTPMEWAETLKPVFIERLKLKYYSAVTGKV